MQTTNFFFPVSVCLETPEQSTFETAVAIEQEQKEDYQMYSVTLSKSDCIYHYAPMKLPYYKNVIVGSTILISNVMFQNEQGQMNKSVR